MQAQWIVEHRNVIHDIVVHRLAGWVVLPVTAGEAFDVLIDTGVDNVTPMIAVAEGIVAEGGQLLVIGD